VPADASSPVPLIPPALASIADVPVLPPAAGPVVAKGSSDVVEGEAVPPADPDTGAAPAAAVLPAPPGVPPGTFRRIEMDWVSANGLLPLALNEELPP
jgi:hypothetical protein